MNEVQALKERVDALEELVRKLAAERAEPPRSNTLTLNGNNHGKAHRQ